MHQRIRRCSSVPVAACAVLAPVAGSAQPLSQGSGSLRVMTYNAGEGTEYRALFRAHNPAMYWQGVGQSFLEAQATDPWGRMQALAAQIAAAAPTLVSLQEVTRWQVGPYDSATRECGPMKVEIDMMPALLKALRALGANYEVAAQTPQFRSTLMPGDLSPNDQRCFRVLNRNLILARSDLGPGQLQWRNPQAGQFGVPSEQATGPTTEAAQPRYYWPESRSWLSVDVQYQGRWLRFIGAHLRNLGDPGTPSTPRQDATELRAVADASPVPVVIAMDANARAAPRPADDTYTDFVAAGYRDAWAEVHPAWPGYTCCQSAALDNPVSQLSRRTDWVLLRGAIQAESAARVGMQPSSRTASGLWPSNHAGVAVQLSVGKVP